MCPLGPNWKYVRMDSDSDGLMPKRQQAIILSNDDPVTRRIYASPGFN